MNRNTKRIILIIALCALFILGCVISYMKEHISPIPADPIGNSAGNLRGKGLFCEYDGSVYFSNPYDQGTLYVMNPDGTDIRKLANISASYINAGGKNLFYYMQSTTGGSGLGYLRSLNGIYRCDLKGNRNTCLKDTIVTGMVLSGNHLYYQNYDSTTFSTIHKMAANDPETDQFLTDDLIDTSCVYNGNIYYGGITQEHYLYAWDTATDKQNTVWQGNLCYPTVVGSYVYYMDIANDYRLCRYDMNQDIIEVLTHDRVDFYNLYENVIYYQKSDSAAPALMRMYADGTGVELVAEGIYNRINTTSTYTYFYPYDEDGLIYRTPNTGPIRVDSFPEALNAALKEQES